MKRKQMYKIAREYIENMEYEELSHLHFYLLEDKNKILILTDEGFDVEHFNDIYTIIRFETVEIIDLED